MVQVLFFFFPSLKLMTSLFFLSVYTWGHTHVMVWMEWIAKLPSFALLFIKYVLCHRCQI